MILIRIASYSAFHPSNLINQVSFAVHIDQEHMDDITCTDQNFDFFFFFFWSNYLHICFWMLFWYAMANSISTFAEMNRISSSVKILPLFFLIFKEGREVRRKIENFIHHTLHCSTPSSAPHLPIFMHKFASFLNTNALHGTYTQRSSYTSAYI